MPGSKSCGSPLAALISTNPHDWTNLPKIRCRIHLDSQAKSPGCKRQFMAFRTILAAKNQLLRKSRKGRKAWIWSLRVRASRGQYLSDAPLAMPKAKAILYLRGTGPEQSRTGWNAQYKSDSVLAKHGTRAVQRYWSYWSFNEHSTSATPVHCERVLVVLVVLGPLVLWCFVLIPHRRSPNPNSQLELRDKLRVSSPVRAIGTN